jgi:hypothetical protein
MGHFSNEIPVVHLCGRLTTLRSSQNWMYLEGTRYVIGTGTDVPGTSKVETLIPTSTASQRIT